ncbi:transcription factor bHLH96 [Brachypodium distachyon]|uniref:BHLH domain-containing protein n=1 Tax=Brachypodium distachyon TaxID=15368 RepID=I1ICS5_BRADI|nr:transcription factor bHLH96 [Brachypodium distachyon]KQK00838.1 hypothetical protein BRADI_3g52150v3 [Brachypodium distachyon]|eukprot:XP_003572839.3 transcription factor bHLH96 [Brachypodium distachyon]
MALVDALCAASSVDAALVYDTFNASSSSAAAAGFLLFDNAAAAAAAAFSDAGIVNANAGPFAAGEDVEAPAPEEKQAPAPARRKRRRRARSCKSREESECQRMTHIAVERNRRRQMNEYLVVLRSLMPDSYVQRGDQASIVGGAIDFVKELEQQLQSLEAQKRTLLVHQQHKAARHDAMPMPMRTDGNGCAVESSSTSNCSSSVTTEEHHASSEPPFAGFFTYPQYVWCHASQQQAAGDSSSGTMMLSAAEDQGGRAGVADVEVSLVETHASVRVMAPRRPGQLLRMVAALQALRLAVLHLNVVSALDSLVLYSLSVKVEEGCGLTTADDIAAAVHHVLCFIHAEAAASQELLVASQ